MERIKMSEEMEFTVVDFEEKEDKCSEMVGHNTMQFEYEKNKGEK